MRVLLSVCLLLCSCSLLFGRLSEQACEQDGPRCDGSLLVLCEQGIALSIDCHSPERCHEEDGGFCGFCGDGAIQAAALEICDDGNTTSGDGCDASCLQELCGDGIINNTTEQCDDGPSNSNTGLCLTDCTPARCGDGIIGNSPGEECEQSNTASASVLCSDDCKLVDAVCGDGVVSAGEICEFSVDNTCLSNCTHCGDGVVDPEESCDDQNQDSFDGCSSSCQLHQCGDGLLERVFGEECDDGNITDGDNCGSLCQLPQCGNGVANALEQCDDGNIINGDGCDNNCTLSSCLNGEPDPGEFCLFGVSLIDDFCRPAAPLIADINQDLLPDFVHAEGNLNAVSVRFSNGAGFFQPVTQPPTGVGATQELALGDFNGDGRQDVFVSSAQAAQAALLLGQPGGAFNQVSPLIENEFFLGGSDQAAVADLDGDGDDELVCASSASPTIFFGGAAPFSSRVTLTGGLSPGAIELSDLNLDDVLDLVGAGPNGVQVWPGQVGGGFAAPLLMSSEGSGGSLIAADLDGDSAPELLTIGFDNLPGTLELLLFRNNGDGTFQPAQHLTAGVSLIAAGDLNGDGFVDLAVLLGDLGVLLGNGDGSFQPIRIISSGFFTDLTVGDLDGDGAAEVIVAAGDRSLLFREVF